MKTVKKPTKAHKGKKVIKAHQGFAADGSRATAEQSKPKSQSVSVAPQGQVGSLRRRAPPPSQPRATLVKEPVRALPKPMDEKDGRGQPLQIRRNLNYSLPPGYMKEMDTQREINKRMRGNKVVADNQANIQRRADAELKRRGGRDQLQAEQMDYYLGGRKGKRPERVDPFKGMSSRERRRAQNATRSEFDETNRQVRKQMGTQRKPRNVNQLQYPSSRPVPTNANNIKNFNESNANNIKNFNAPKPTKLGGLLGRKPVPTNAVPVNSFQNKGGAVKKKYGIEYKKGGYVSRSTYGSVDNLKTKR